MTDDQEAVAPSEATPEVVQPDAGQEGQPEGQDTPPASEPDEKSEAQKRRERRRAQEIRQQEAAKQAQEAAIRLERIKAAVQAEPKESDFSDIIDYAAAKGAWNYARQSAQFQVAEVAEQAEQAKAVAEAQRAAQQMARQADFQQDAADARTRYQDFDAALQVAANPQFVSRELSEMVLESDQPADLAYYLGKNPQEASRLSSLPPTLAARELGKLEARLVANPPKIASTAPPPINPVRASGTPVMDASKMSVADYAAWRASGGKVG